MKVTIDIDCTPQEARSFFGLPDVEPMQKEILARMQEQILAGMSAPDLQSLMTQWVTTPNVSLDMLQKAFGAFGMGAGAGTRAGMGAGGTAPGGRK